VQPHGTVQDFCRCDQQDCGRGEIDALDPGGFGAITITKSITLNGGTGAGFASILVSGTNGVNIAAGNTGVVTLRYIDVQGIGTGINGISITSASKVHIENSLVTGFTNRGITDGRRASGFLYITDTTVRDNANGVVLAPAGGSINAIMDNVRSFGNTTAGFLVSGVSFATIRNSLGSGNGTGFLAQGAPAEMNLENCVAASNGTGVQNGVGGATTTRLSNCVIVENTTGVSNLAGSLLSFGNNKIGGNTGANTGVTAASPGQQ
jgi:hypothetical protein